jgi:hypothetical protein
MYFTRPKGKSFLFYVIYGDFSADFSISQKKYRTNGLPEGVDLMKFGPQKHPELVKSFIKAGGYVWKNLKRNNPNLASKINDASECFVIKGELADSPNLDYLRDVIGIITYLLDNGGAAVFDTQAFTFYEKEEWTEAMFDPNGSVPTHHVLILSSKEKGAKWIHTRGMRKFGRPDLGIHGVTPKYENAVMELFNRLIIYQAWGGIIKNKEEVKMKTLPPGMWFENKGNVDDPDFNNKHIEINWV